MFGEVAARSKFGSVQWATAQTTSLRNSWQDGLEVRKLVDSIKQRFTAFDFSALQSSQVWPVC